MSFGTPYDVTHEIDQNGDISMSGSDVFMCLELRQIKHPSNKLSQFFKDIILYPHGQKHQQKRKYKDVRIKDLHTSTSGDSFQSGQISTFFPYVSMEFIKYCSGHS